jgi:hypothetical protein
MSSEKTIETLKKSINTKIDKLGKNPEKKKDLTKIYKNIITSSNIKEKVIIDITGLLKNYQGYFDKLDKELNIIDQKFSDQNIENVVTNVGQEMNQVTGILFNNIQTLKKFYSSLGYSNDDDKVKRLRDLEKQQLQLIENLNNYQLSYNPAKKTAIGPDIKLWDTIVPTTTWKNSSKPQSIFKFPWQSGGSISTKTIKPKIIKKPSTTKKTKKISTTKKTSTTKKSKNNKKN